MKKQYDLDSSGLSITLEIDTAIITPEIASQMNGFWSSAKDCLDASDGDIYQAIARQAAGNLLACMINGRTEAGSILELSKEDGFQPCADGGMKIVSYDIPGLSFDDFDVEEIPVK